MGRLRPDEDAFMDDRLGRKKRDHRLEMRPLGRGAVTGLSPQMKTGRLAYTARLVILDDLDARFKSACASVQIEMARSHFPTTRRISHNPSVSDQEPSEIACTFAPSTRPENAMRGLP